MTRQPFQPGLPSSTIETARSDEPTPITPAALNSPEILDQFEPNPANAQRTHSKRRSAALLLSNPLRWWQGRSLRLKAITLGIIVGTIPVTVVGMMAITVANQAMTEKITTVEKANANHVAGKVELFMRERYGDIQLLTSLRIFTNPTLRRAATTADQESILDEYIEAYGVYDSIAVFDLNGDVIAQSNGRPLSNNRNTPHFQEVLRTDKTVITQPLQLKPDQGLGVYFAAPIKDSVTDKTIAIAQTRVPIDRFQVAMSSDAQADLETFYLINAEGNIFATARPANAGQPETTPPNSSNLIAAQSMFPDYLELKAGNRLETKLTDQKLLIYRPIAEVEGVSNLGWHLLGALGNEIAFEPQQQLLQSLLFGTGIMALLVILAAGLLASRATRPLLVAADAVERIGQGDLDTRLNFIGTDEVASLGENINTMAQQLQQALAAQAFESAQERVLTLAKGSGVVRSPDLNRVFDEVVESARSLLNLDRVVIYAFEQAANGGGVISEAVEVGLPSALKERVSDACIPPETRTAYQQGRMVIARDVSDAGFEQNHLKLLKRLKVKASLIMPILNGDQLFGLLIAHVCDAPFDWQETEINFMSQLGYELGLTVYRVKLLEQTIELADGQRQLKERLQSRALELLQEVDPINQGDLTIRARVTPDEIGTLADSYNAIVANLRKLVTQVQITSNQVTTTASTNEKLLLELNQEASRQATEINSALDQVEELATAIRLVAENARQAEMAMQQATRTVEAGDAAMNRTVDGIQSIRTTVSEAAEKVKRLGESSQKISTIVDLISAFTAQTNMLALNASIEASRAGEQGRGFAVVAEEVRSLAQQSSEATNEIKKLVASILAETGEVVTAMEMGTEQVTTGTRLVDETRQSLNQITSTSFQIRQLVNMIAQSAALQTQTSETVTQTIQEVAAISNQTAAEASQVLETFEQLREVAQTLQASVGQFKV